MRSIDFDYIGSFLFETAPADPESLVEDENEWATLPSSPPPISGYRKADVAGIACWNCAHFTIVGDPDNDGDLDGVCELFEAQAEAEFTCDRFTAHADLLRQSPHTSWNEDMADQMKGAMGPSAVGVDYSDDARLNEIFLSGDATEEDGLVWKEILRTGEWKQTPTSQGVIDRHLQIVRDGESDPAKGIISLAEIHRNFEERAVPYVTIPLSDDQKDHKNIARLNTGFVRKLKLVDRDGIAVLIAGMDFTEPEVKDKVLRGTIPDCSAGIPFGVTRRRDKKTFNTVLDHVCLTAKPFIDGLSPFGLAAADDNAELPVEAWEAEVVEPPQPEQEESEKPPSLSFLQQQKAINSALGEQLRLAADYSVEDINSESGIVIVHNKISGDRWEVNYKLTGDSENPVRLASVEHWKLIEREQQPEPVAASEPDDITRARELRELRLSQPTGNSGGINMSVSAPSLEGVELSDEARNRVNAIIEENERLRRTTRESQVNDRISELESIGLKDRPGALKFYREVMLSDDGGPAIILFADSDDDSKKERLTTLNVLDRFIDSLKADGSVTFSDQALQSGNDTPPPKDASDEKAPLEERVEEANKALYGGRKRTGRK